MTLVEQILDKFAEEEGIGETRDSWVKFKEGHYYEDDCNPRRIKRAVEIALRLSQAEVNKNINEAIKRHGEWTENLADSIDKGDYWIREFDLKKFLKEKRLQSKVKE